MRTYLKYVLCFIGLVFITGCGTAQPINPSFALTVDEARHALTDMHDNKVTLKRPVIVAGGIGDPGVMASSLADQIEEIADDGSVVEPVSFFGAGTFAECRERLLEAVAELPVELPDEKTDPATIEVDVIAISMGGLVARYAAMPDEQGDDSRHIRIARLFTIASPHRGANLADLPTLDSRVRAMRAGSDFLEQLNDHLSDAEYDLVPYVRLDDVIVGAEQAAPPGESVWWLPNRVGEFAHLGAAADPRIVADIARRLRDEKPFTSPPAQPLPGPDTDSAVPDTDATTGRASANQS